MLYYYKDLNNLTKVLNNIEKEKIKNLKLV